MKTNNLRYIKSFAFGALVLGLVFGNIAGAKQLFVNLNNLAPAPPFASWATAATNIQDAVDAATGGDEVVVSNGVYQTGATAVYGMSNRVAVTKPLFVHSVNGPAVTIIQGYQMPGTNNGPAAVRCAYLTNGAVLAGFTLKNGGTQASGDAYKQQSGGGVWCESASAVLTNCLLEANSAFYAGGAVYHGTLDKCTLAGNSAYYGGGSADGVLNNCTVVDNSAFDGGGAYRVSLNNCIVTDNFAYDKGGGAFLGLYIDSGALVDNNLNNCFFEGNTAYSSGGAVCDFESYTNNFINNCVLTGNSANLGGGISFFFAITTMNNCTIVNNSADSGGGVYGPYYNWMDFYSPVILYNCIVYYNSATNGDFSGVGFDGPSISHCCVPADFAYPDAFSVSNAPSFVDQAGGNVHLGSNSPCINAGFNAAVPGTTDFDGNPRIAGGTVDVGAYEYQSPASTISYAWLQNYGLLTDGSADYLDTDNDGLNNYQEWIAGTDPTNSSSVLRLLAPLSTSSGVQITWGYSDYTARDYILLRSTNLSAPFSIISSNVFKFIAPGTIGFTDTNATPPGPYFYRVQVQVPNTVITPGGGSG